MSQVKNEEKEKMVLEEKRILPKLVPGRQVQGPRKEMQQAGTEASKCQVLLGALFPYLPACTQLSILCKSSPLSPLIKYLSLI